MLSRPGSRTESSDNLTEVETETELQSGKIDSDTEDDAEIIANDSNTKPRRIHPSFPTLEEAAEGAIVYSDHLPILARLDNDINILSLNVLGANACSGLATNRDWESDTDAQNRYKRIIDGVILNSIKKHNVKIILLQEVSIELFEVYLKEQLDDEWEVIADVENRLISCFNKTEFHLVDSKIDSTNKIVTLNLQHNTKHFSFDVNHVWGIYNAVPRHTEQLYEQKLMNSTASQSVIMGDTNSRIAPLHNHPQNITTGAIPPSITKNNLGIKENIQLPDYPDGAFIRKEEKIEQVDTHVLDFQTGDILDNQSEEFHPQESPVRMVLCLDHSYKSKILIDNNDIFGYEKTLQEAFNDPNIIVRMASDANNHKFIGVTFSSRSPVYAHIKSELEEDSSLQFEYLDDSASTDRLACVYAPLNKIDKLHECISTYIREEAYPAKELYREMIAELTKQINTLSKQTNFFYRLFFRNTEIKKLCLENLKQNLEKAFMTKSSLTQAFQTWKDTEKLQIDGEIYSNKDIVKSHRNRLFSKTRSPRSPRTTTHNLIKHFKTQLKT